MKNSGCRRVTRPSRPQGGLSPHLKLIVSAGGVGYGEGAQHDQGSPAAGSQREIRKKINYRMIQPKGKGD
jgi:hypothetical protein